MKIILDGKEIPIPPEAIEGSDEPGWFPTNEELAEALFASPAPSTSLGKRGRRAKEK